MQNKKAKNEVIFCSVNSACSSKLKDIIYFLLELYSYKGGTIIVHIPNIKDSLKLAVKVIDEAGKAKKNEN